MEIKKNATYGDIAKYTKFSKTTISRFFNDPDTLAPASREIIAQALEDLHYQENKVARILANGRTEFIGVIVPDFYHHFFYEILNHILGTYEHNGYKFLVFVGNKREEIERRYIQELMAYQIEGLIVLSHTLRSQELARLQIPVVTIEREDRFVSSVNTDNRLGGRMAAAHLAELDCDVLIHINSHSSEGIPAYDRVSGFSQYCRENGLRHQVIIRPLDVSYEADKQTLTEILEQVEAQYPGHRKGIFISNDTLANGFLNVLFHKFGCLPSTYRLIGFDDSPASRAAVVPISTVGQRLEQLAQEAMALLSDQIRAKKSGAASSAPVHRVVEPVLIRRDTTAG